MSGPPQTWAACLTPPGRAAIAVVALRGPEAWNMARELFRPKAHPERQLPAEIEAARCWFGSLGGEVADEVVLTLARTDPVPWVEVHCHGGPELVRWLLETLHERGARVCAWQELERRTAEAPLRAEAAIALAEARTARTAAILLDQLAGALEAAVDAALGLLHQGDLARAGRQLAELTRHTPLGRHLTTPWRVVVAGAPNAGKSSLVNALAGYQRSVVSAKAGTTRDVVTTFLAIDGWLVELIDTAGLREDSAGLESQGIRHARQAVAAADVCLWVLDGAAPPLWPAGDAPTTLPVVNKVDLPPSWDWDQAPGAVRVSALGGIGLEDLCQALSARLVPDAPPPRAAVPFTPRLCDLAEAAYQACLHGSVELARRALEDMHGA